MKKLLLLALTFLSFIPAQSTKFYWIGGPEEAGQYKVVGSIGLAVSAAYIVGSSILYRDHIDHKYETDMKAVVNPNNIAQAQSSQTSHRIGTRIGYGFAFITGSMFIFGKYLESKK